MANMAKRKVYRMTPKGYLSVTYDNMKRRVRTHPRYLSLELLKRSEFYKFAVNNRVFLRLLQAYKLSGKQRKYAPSIERRNPENGYTLNNIEFITLSENSKRSRITCKRFQLK
jgi:hypothetical protein